MQQCAGKLSILAFMWMLFWHASLSLTLMYLTHGLMPRWGQALIGFVFPVDLISCVIPKSHLLAVTLHTTQRQEEHTNLNSVHRSPGGYVGRVAWHPQGKPGCPSVLGNNTEPPPARRQNDDIQTISTHLKYFPFVNKISTWHLKELKPSFLMHISTSFSSKIDEAIHLTTPKQQNIDFAVVVWGLVSGERCEKSCHYITCLSLSQTCKNISSNSTVFSHLDSQQSLPLN